MKLIYESLPADVEQEINESTGKKVYKIKGIYSTIGEKNKNGRIYPRSIWEKCVSEYQNELNEGTSNALMELDHPPRTKVDMMEAVAKINKLYIEGKYVMGEATLLDNPKANQLKTLIDNGITMAVSSRGVGKINEGIVSDFKLITYDIIPNQGQSDHNGQMKGIVEGILEGKEFMLNESGDIVESKPKEPTITDKFTTQEIQEALKEKLSNLFKSL